MHGNLSSREDNVDGSQRFSHWIGHDLYNFIICRDLAQNTFTHVSCGISIRGREEVEEHLGTCDSNNPPENIATCYNVPGLPDCIYTFGWAFFCDGYWHLEVHYKGNVFNPGNLHSTYPTPAGGIHKQSSHLLAFVCKAGICKRSWPLL